MTTLDIQRIDPAILPAAVGGYTHGTLVAGASRILFVSGQVPWADDVLGGRRPALTIIITDIYSEDWLLEIDVIAVA